MGVRAEHARAEVNTAFGAQTEFVTPEEVKKICPHIDLDGGGLWPVQGGTYHVQGATARHDRIVWAYAEGAMKRGVHVHQRTAVNGLLMEGDRVTGVETTRGPLAAGAVVGELRLQRDDLVVRRGQPLVRARARAQPGLLPRPGELRRRGILRSLDRPPLVG